MELAKAIRNHMIAMDPIKDKTIDRVEWLRACLLVFLKTSLKYERLTFSVYSLGRHCALI